MDLERICQYVGAFIHSYVCIYWWKCSCPFFKFIYIYICEHCLFFFEWLAKRLLASCNGQFYDFFSIIYFSMHSLCRPCCKMNVKGRIGWSLVFAFVTPSERGEDPLCNPPSFPKCQMHHFAVAKALESLFCAYFECVWSNWVFAPKRVFFFIPRHAQKCNYTFPNTQRSTSTQTPDHRRDFRRFCSHFWRKSHL